MAKLDSYSIAILCPECRASGTAQVSEDDHRYAASPRLEIHALSDGFSIAQTEGHQDDALVRCECLTTFTV
jgi:hypothetical protein